MQLADKKEKLSTPPKAVINDGLIQNKINQAIKECEFYNQFLIRALENKLPFTNKLSSILVENFKLVQKDLTALLSPYQESFIRSIFSLEDNYASQGLETLQNIFAARPEFLAYFLSLPCQKVLSDFLDKYSALYESTCLDLMDFYRENIEFMSLPFSSPVEYKQFLNSLPKTQKEQMNQFDDEFKKQLALYPYAGDYKSIISVFPAIGRKLRVPEGYTEACIQMQETAQRLLEFFACHQEAFHFLSLQLPTLKDLAAKYIQFQKKPAGKEEKPISPQQPVTAQTSTPPRYGNGLVRSPGFNYKNTTSTPTPIQPTAESQFTF